MKKQKITYAIRNMMEYHYVLKIGKAQMHITFTDGSASAAGCSPAKFTTDNFIVQHAIEHSPEFTKGFIEKFSIVNLDEEVEIERNAPKVEPTKEVVEQAEETAKEVSENETFEPEKNEEVETSEEQKLNVVKVNDINEAKDYLAEKFGVNRSSMRSTKAILEQAAINGIEFEGI